MKADELRQAIADALAEPNLKAIDQRLSGAGWSEMVCVMAIQECSRLGRLEPLDRIVQGLTGSQLCLEEAASIRRYCILAAMKGATERLESVSLPEEVKDLVAREFLSMARPDDVTRNILEERRSALLTQAKIATLNRFPTGCLQCEYSGIPRSYLLRAAAGDWPRLCWLLLFELHGTRPCLETHMNPKVRFLRKEDGMKAYLRIAGILEHDPRLKAMVGFSWLRSRETHRVSPHLRWINEVIVDNGGFETEIGPAEIDSGVFSRSDERKRLFERGEFRPTVGMVIWPRQAMIAWARRYRGG